MINSGFQRNGSQTTKRLRILVIALASIVCSALSTASSVWKISNGGHHLYLAGTLHIMTPSEYPLPTSYDQAYANASELVFEVDFDAVSHSEVITAQARYLMYPEGQSLQQNLSAELWEALENKVRTYGANAALINRMKPSLAATSIAMMAFSAEGVTAAQGVDDYFLKMAKRDKKNVSALESLEDQFKAVAVFNEYSADEVISSTLEEIEDPKSSFEHMVSAWRSGNMDKLTSVFITPIQDEFPKAYSAILAHRNNQWMQKIHEFLKSETIEMVLVGTAHMAGPDGLIPQLQQAGYTVTQQFIEESPSP